MWPFRKKPSPPQEAFGPMEMLFASYVLDVIGHLPPEKRQAVEAMTPKIASALGTTTSDWRRIVAAALHLSENIDYAILDLWYRNGDIAKNSGTTLEPEQFAGMFVVEYKKDGSQIDVWPGDSLAQAKARIAARRS